MTELPGLVKYTSDHLSKSDCAPGGALNKQLDSGEYQLTHFSQYLRDLHDAVHIGTQDTSTEKRHGVSDIANSMTGDRLATTESVHCFIQ